MMQNEKFVLTLIDEDEAGRKVYVVRIGGKPAGTYTALPRRKLQAR